MKLLGWLDHLPLEVERYPDNAESVDRSCGTSPRRDESHPWKAVSEMSIKAEKLRDSSSSGSTTEPDAQQVEKDTSNKAMADPQSEAAVEPVPRVKRPPQPQDEDRRVKTTHDVHGGGNPRLVMLFNDSVDFAIEEQKRLDGQAQKEIPKEFPLVPGVTRIGSADDCEIWLPELRPHHAEVRRDETDEYSIFDLSDGDTSVDGGRAPDGIPLRSGRRIEVGRWTAVYEREEYADHGSPYGGHVGGAFDGYRKDQPVPRPRGTSPEGGSEPTATDPGEYY